MSRTQTMFAALAAKGEGAFIPFVVLGDPDPAASRRIIEGLIAAGADALELGFPFSDPIADGPVIQRAGRRALEAGAGQETCFASIASVRARHPEIPIGLLVYANLVLARGIATFFAAAHRAGADSVLIADLPAREAAPFRRAANRAGIELVLVLPVHADDAAVARIAGASQGYLYLLSRKGVTGARGGVALPARALIERLKALGAAPPVLGFGIGAPLQVRAALAAGCRGVISGSAVVAKIEAVAEGGGTPEDVFAFARMMKAATRAQHESPCREGHFAT